MHRFIIILTLTALTTLGLTGCNESGSHTHDTAPEHSHDGAGSNTIAVLDVNIVSQALGFDKQLTAKMQEINNQLLAELGQIQQDLKNQLDAKRLEVGENPTEEQEAELAAFEANLNRDFIAQQNRARQGFAQIQQQFRTKFYQDLVRPVASEIAEAEGFSVVIFSNTNVVYNIEEVDITDEVIGKLRAKGQATSSTDDSGDESTNTSDGEAPAPETDTEG